MDLYRCESPECDFVTANPDLEQCPVCGGAFFVPATEEEVAPHGWFYLSQEAARAHRETDAYAASARGAKGDAACQCEQGRRLHEGRGVARDQAAAAACFEAAAAQNSPDGQCLLGLCHEKGEGVPQSWENAAFLYRQAADQGFAPAQCNLGWCYEYGKGVPQDPAAPSTGTVPLLYRKMPGQSVVSASAI